MCTRVTSRVLTPPPSSIGVRDTDSTTGEFHCQERGLIYVSDPDPVVVEKKVVGFHSPNEHRRDGSEHKDFGHGQTCHRGLW